ncbi:uncharacterized protein LOC120191324 [Hibiscus syriacus]|uniref:uncharacterized protein LOC120191324 n=1 Tax=Hibiscus syriacus TaxID=106335 RepID=UPI001922FB19|nr:uncharacterized protein LOC120191324 [Hibiscus syriacus]
MKVQELEANWWICLRVVTGKRMREWSVLLLRLLINWLKRRKRPRKVMIGSSMCKESGRKRELVEMIWFRTFLQQIKLELKGSPIKWRIMPRDTGKGKKKPKKKEMIKSGINARINTERRKVTEKIRIGTKRRRRRLRRKVNIGIWRWIT